MSSTEEQTLKVADEVKNVPGGIALAGSAELWTEQEDIDLAGEIRIDVREALRVVRHSKRKARREAARLMNICMDRELPVDLPSRIIAELLWQATS